MTFLSKFKTDITTCTLTNFVKLEEITPQCENIYFIPGKNTKPENIRLSDHHMVSTTTFFIDVDIKNNLIENGDMAFMKLEDIDEETHLEYAEWIKDFMDQSETFKNWSFIVFTGNGIHIHFIGEEVEFTERAHWRYGLKYLFEKWDRDIEKYICPGILKCDKAVFNESRLRRLPGTINSKKGIHRRCRVLYEQDKDFDTKSILTLGESYFTDKQEADRKQAEIEKKMISQTLDVFEQSIFDRVNNIPIEYIVSQINASFSFEKNKNWYTGKYREGFFKTKHNRLCTTGSHHFPTFIKNGTERDSYSVFDLIHLYLAKSGDFSSQGIKNTIYFIKENYGQ